MSNYPRISAGIFVTMVLIGSSILLSSESGPAQAAISNWQKGVSIDPRSPQDFGTETFKQSLRDAAGMGINSVSLIIPYYQSTPSSNDIARGWNTPTDEALISAIEYAHSLHLRVDLKPHLQVSSDPAMWRANIYASDRDMWYSAYEAMLLHYAFLAQTYHVEEITIGTELINMASSYVNTDNTVRWVKMIENLRAQFSGSLSYSANWGSAVWNNEKNSIKFWDKLDSIGVSAYLPLTAGNNYTSSTLKNAWDTWNTNEIKTLYDAYHKPIIFTEVGYRSMDGALARPSQWQTNNSVDLQEQVDGYRALFEYWGQVPYFNGVNIWSWSSDPNAGGSTDSDFTPQHKPAQDLIKQWFTDSVIEPTPTPTPNTASVGDIVIHATDVVPSDIHGNWILTPMADAADGSTLLNADMGKPKVLASAAPADYVDFKFNAQAHVPYHIWLRMKASKNNYNNDSVYLQFSDISDKNKIGTANAQSVILEEGTNAGVLNWGWNDNNYGGLGAAIMFTTNGAHTLRVQAREDGAMIDQIVLSPATYFNTKPGAFKNDTTILSKPAAIVVPTATPIPVPTATVLPSPIVKAVSPGSGALVHGAEELQAMITGWPANAYRMYWQVDNDRLNQMDNESDGITKYAWIDFTGWTWHSDGKYLITYIAQDMSGREIAKLIISVIVH